MTERMAPIAHDTSSTFHDCSKKPRAVPQINETVMVMV